MTPHYTMSDLIHNFLNGAKSGTSYGSLHIRGGDYLHSYAEIVCRMEITPLGQTKYVLVQPNRCSMTTVKHMNMIYRTALELQVCYVDKTVYARIRSDKLKRAQVIKLKRVDQPIRNKIYLVK